MAATQRAPAAKETDWPALIVSIATLVEKLGILKGEKLSPIELVKQVADLVKRETSPAASLKEQLGVLNEVLDIRERTAPPEDDPILSLAKENLPKLFDIMKAVTRKKGSATTVDDVRAAVASQAGVQPPKELPPAEEWNRMLPWQKLVVVQKKRLLSFAAAGKDPEIAALTAYEFMPEGVRGSVQELLSQEDAVEQMLAAVPEFSAYPKWVAAFLTALHEQFFPAEEQEPEPEPGEPVEEVE